MGRMTSKGQITLPKKVRDELELKAGDAVLFDVFDGYTVLIKIPDPFDRSRPRPPIPPDVVGKPWKEIRAEAWRKQTERHLERGR